MAVADSYDQEPRDEDVQPVAQALYQARLSQTDPFEIAATRTRQAVMPEGGRQEGPITNFLSEGPPIVKEIQNPAEVLQQLRDVPGNLWNEFKGDQQGFIAKYLTPGPGEIGGLIGAIRPRGSMPTELAKSLDDLVKLRTRVEVARAAPITTPRRAGRPSVWDAPGVMDKARELSGQKTPYDKIAEELTKLFDSPFTTTQVQNRLWREGLAIGARPGPVPKGPPPIAKIPKEEYEAPLIAQIKDIITKNPKISYAQIASEVGKAPNNLYDWMKARGLSNNRTKPESIDWTDKLERAREMAAQGMSYPAMADALGVELQTLRGKVWREGISNGQTRKGRPNPNKAELDTKIRELLMDPKLTRADVATQLGLSKNQLAGKIFRLSPEETPRPYTPGIGGKPKNVAKPGLAQLKSLQEPTESLSDAELAEYMKLFGGDK